MEHRPHLTRQPLDYAGPRFPSVDDYERSLRDDRHSLDEEGEHVWNELKAHERLHGPARHVRIGSNFPWWELAVCWLVAAAIGAMLAIGGVL